MCLQQARKPPSNVAHCICCVLIQPLNAKPPKFLQADISKKILNKDALLLKTTERTIIGISISRAMGFTGSNLGNLQDLERSRIPYHLLCVRIQTFSFLKALGLQGGKPVLTIVGFCETQRFWISQFELASRYSSIRTPQELRSRRFGIESF
jgi:hypothetical protein